MLSSPLRDRFGAVQRLDFYDDSDLAAIVRRSAGILGIEIAADAAALIAARSRGTPRLASLSMTVIKNLFLYTNNLKSRFKGPAVAQLAFALTGSSTSPVRLWVFALGPHF